MGTNRVLITLGETRGHAYMFLLSVYL